ncbi:MAG TPA: CGNR zinc finger domain-containing protein [Thermomicrobiales bacterium]|nr:CGNR zinc finger domain-containing protein [Thermomicrobiales bacterium]
MRDYLGHLSLAEALINTYDITLDSPELLPTPRDLAAFLSARGLLPEGVSVSEDDLAEVRALRADLRVIFEAGDEAVAVSILNGLLAAAPVSLRLERDEEGSWRVEPRPADELPLARRVTVEATLGLADAVEAYGFERLRVCDADPCRDVFLDTSRNRSRRYCGQKCANRHNVAAFRQRQRS